MSVKVIASLKIKFDTGLSSYGDGCTIGQIRDQAKIEAEKKIKTYFSGVEVVGEPLISIVMIDE